MDEPSSMFAACGSNPEAVLTAVANRYVGHNPPHPMTCRAFCADGILKKHDYSYDFNLAERFPGMDNGEHIYAWSKLWSDQPAPMSFILHCYGPLQFWVNGIPFYKASIVDEQNDKRRIGVTVELQQGWNHLVLDFTKTEAGCGGSFGPGSYKSRPVHVLAPTPERSGHEGWIFTGPMRKLPQPPGPGLDESAGIVWHPRLDWGAQRTAPAMARIFGGLSGRRAIAWTRLVSTLPAGTQAELRGRAYSPAELYVDGAKAAEIPEGPFAVPVALDWGRHDLVVRCASDKENWGFAWEEPQAGIALEMPFPVQGSRDAWLYAGPFAAEEPLPSVSGMPYELIPAKEGDTYWRLDQPHTWVRLFGENALFGKWNYPLGVTLYGLLQAGTLLKRQDLLDYVRRHVESCTRLYRYAIWDRDRFGAAGVLNTMATLDSLDDCGSFGATMLLLLQDCSLAGADELAELIGDYIGRVQYRLPTGALFRKSRNPDWVHETVWCDDLYMSVPFLCRYYMRTGDQRYLDDAANQFIQFRKLMYMPEQQIMSHVYVVTLGKATRVPWGRGNGWVLFSLSELLAAMPEKHSRREELLRFFRELCHGYLRLQGSNGLWHQVLTDHESYEETSCTSMFLYAFARGIRFGWLEETLPYVDAVRKAWNGMTQISIDRLGNVYGVCRGSGYSFNADYYKDELPWLLNDTHGIGIVLLAGIEVLQLEKHLGNTGYGKVAGQAE
jgi:rhamnogalacturonyl hydrolase YesR